MGLLGLLGSACAGGADSVEDGVVERAFALAGDDADVRLRLFHVARQSAIIECMAENGFEYRPEPFFRSPSVSSPHDFGILRLDRARQLGYGMAAGATIEMEIPPSPNDEVRRDLKPAEQVAYDRALYGTGTDDRVGGCLGAAEDVLTGEYPDYLGASEWAEVERQVERYIETFLLLSASLWVDWSACMSDAGYDYATTFDARDDLTAAIESGALDVRSVAFRDTEFQLAIADAQCQEPIIAELIERSDQAQEQIFGTIIEPLTTEAPRV